MQKYVKNEKRYRLINFICLLAVYKKLIGTGRVLGTSILRYAISLVMRKPVLRFPTRSDTNRAVQPQKLAKGLKFRIQEEGLYYLCSENKGACQLCICFSHIQKAGFLVMRLE